ncbi:MAG: TonB-dependent receptor [Flavobacteriia bacterium]|nr:TonB-dependent receptor [Flavobacteriia bacterium]
MFNKLIVCGLIVIAFHWKVLSQDTIKPLATVSELEQVTITHIVKSTNDNISQDFTRLEILKYQPQDVGAILQKLSGSTLKSYGGLGGMKTISVRGLGAQHTNVVIDGFLVNNTQSGQINLANIQTDNINSISLNTGGRSNYLLPASAYVSGSILTILTFENSFDTNRLQVRFNSKYGSFGEIDNYLAIKKNHPKFFISAFGKYRQANGKYPYSYLNGNNIVSGIRSNNDLKDWYSGFNFGFYLSKKTTFRVIYKNFGANQGLPGSVILYNPFTDQRLISASNSLNFNFNSKIRLLNIRIFSGYQDDKTHYIDPTFLNNSGGISMRYYSQTIHSGISAYRRLGIHSILFGGIDTKFSQLEFIDSKNAEPNRNHTTFIIGGNTNFSKLKAEFQISGQFIQENNNLGERASNVSRYNPFLLIENQEFWKWNVKFTGWYKNSFRIPTFNELYYNGIGNVKLKPEDANQYSFGVNFQPIDKMLKLKITTNSYFSYVKNQILAIPTKNLFVWSMQNIGEVHTRGLEIRMDIQYKLNRNFSLEMNGNYTFQQSLDYSDKFSPTYKNQVAYIPKHTGNGSLTVNYKNSGMIFSSYCSSMKYAMNENISSNIIDGFALFDFGIYSKVKQVNNHEFRIQFNIKNCFNSSYAFVKYYVMPGRSFLISLNYALH